MSEAAALGIDLGGTQIKAVVIDRGRRRAAARAGGDGRLGCAAVGGADRRDCGETRGAARGAFRAGLAARDRRSIAHMPGRLAGLEGLDWTDYLERRSLVPVTNDAHASLLGEAWIGAAAGLRDVLMLTLGTGVGGAIISDGRLLRGAIGRAGHLATSASIWMARRTSSEHRAAWRISSATTASARAAADALPRRMS